MTDFADQRIARLNDAHWLAVAKKLGRMTRDELLAVEAEAGREVDVATALYLRIKEAS